MIHSLFIINSSGYVVESMRYSKHLIFWFRFSDVFLEKHWKAVISRSVCDYFFDAQNKAPSPSDIPPVIATPHHYLISIFRCNVYVVAVCMTEGEFAFATIELDRVLTCRSISVPPLFVIEFLHRVIDTFTDYFNDCSESIIKENCVVVYEILDEMLDNGFPLATESNILKELIKPPNLLTNVLNSVTGKTK